ncbi:hypothetical protein TNCV_2535981 [Trichonephila clavipes]|nr:hypothetical protein TNCV_2535981 [Trichonephila clavipes]
MRTNMSSINRMPGPVAPRDVLRHGPACPGFRLSTTMRASSRSSPSLDKIIIRIISTVKCYFRLYSLKKWEFWTKCQQPTCDDRRPCADLCLPPYTIITQRWHSVEPLNIIESLAPLSSPEGKIAICKEEKVVVGLGTRQTEKKRVPWVFL